MPLRRTPPGVRELKQTQATPSLSLSRRTPPGVRELKLNSEHSADTTSSRTPPGVRELKLNFSKRHLSHETSHPSRGA